MKTRIGHLPAERKYWKTGFGIINSMSPGPGLAKPADILIRHNSYAYLDAIQRASNSSRVLSLSLSFHFIILFGCVISTRKTCRHSSGRT
jgi:anthranilate/para-aminobenzoate synthase component II